VQHTKVLDEESVHQKCFNYALTNLLFGLCRSVWMIELLVNLPSPILSWSSSTPFYPRSVASQEANPNSFSFHYLHLWACSWILWRAWGCVSLCVGIDRKTNASRLMLTWWSMEKWNVTLVLKTLIIPTKHYYGKDHMCSWKTFEKQEKKTWNITLY